MARGRNWRGGQRPEPPLSRTLSELVRCVCGAQWTAPAGPPVKRLLPGRWVGAAKRACLRLWPTAASWRSAEQRAREDGDRVCMAASAALAPALACRTPAPARSSPASPSPSSAIPPKPSGSRSSAPGTLHFWGSRHELWVRGCGVMSGQGLRTGGGVGVMGITGHRASALPPFHHCQLECWAWRECKSAESLQGSQASQAQHRGVRAGPPLGPPHAAWCGQRANVLRPSGSCMPLLAPALSRALTRQLAHGEGAELERRPAA